MSKETMELTPELYKCACGGTAAVLQSETGHSVRCERDPGFASVPVFPSQKKAIRAWNKAQEEMDNTTACVVCAYHTGKSYGRYMATLPVGMPAVRYPKKEAAAARPVIEMRCIQCGMLIPVAVRSKKYCSEECAERYREKQRRIRQKLAAEIIVEAAPEQEPRYCEICAQQIPPDSGRYRYCSGLCATKAIRIQSRENRKRRKAAAR